MFLHSAKSPLHSAKALPSVALGKVRSANFFSAKGLCRVLFIGALGKIKTILPSAWGGTRQNIFGRSTLTVNGCFAEGLTQHSAKKKFIFFKNYFAECPSLGTRQSFLIIFLKITLPSAPIKALGKFFLFFLKKYFAECPSPGTRQRISGFFKKNTLPSDAAQALGKVFLFFFKNTLPSAPAQTLGKVFFKKKILCRVRQPRHSAKNFWIFFEKNFAECLVHGTRQRPREL